jgi:HEPN domain-containing protein
VTYHAEWLAQAERDLEVAQLLFRAEKFEWATYAGQQAAEKAAKALRIVLGTDANDMASGWGHDIARLLGTIPTLDPIPNPELARAGELTVHNEQARYPGLRGKDPRGQAPFRTYSKQAAEEGLKIAEAIVGYSRQTIPVVAAMWSARAPAPGTP